MNGELPAFVRLRRFSADAAESSEQLDYQKPTSVSLRVTGQTWTWQYLPGLCGGTTCVGLFVGHAICRTIDAAFRASGADAKNRAGRKALDVQRETGAARQD